ncbi:MAG: response regulator transcription factor [Chlorobi bacterium]|nr:response regulator transcription factor [Chlorobiota bacterium]
MIKVIIVEDIKTIRDGLSALVNGADELTCAAAYASCEDMLEEIEQIEPDVILMDIKLKGITGIEGVRRVKKLPLETSIIMLTVHEDNQNIFDSLMAGADGYLLKTTRTIQIIEAIKDVHNGGSPMNSSIANKVIRLMRLFQTGKKLQDPIALSERETEILNRISNGAAYKNVAGDLFISIHTVRYHVRNIYKKLQVGSQSEAVASAIKRGLI